MSRKAFVAIAALLLAACHKPAVEPPATKAVASIQDLMQAIVDPNADAIWESVSSEVSAAGSIDHQPQTDAEWMEIRHRALLLAEAGNLLQLSGRSVTHGGKAVEDAHVEGILDPAEIAQLLKQQPQAFNAFARTLQAAAEQTIAAVDARNVDGLLEAGYHLDRACESCHMVFWYPGDKRPPGR